jgi:hypothetical protein
MVGGNIPHGMGARQMVAVEQLADQYDFMRREGGIDMSKIDGFRQGIFFHKKDGIIVQSTSSQRWYIYFPDMLTVLPKEGADHNLFSTTMINRVPYLTYHSHGEILHVSEDGTVIRPHVVEKEQYTWSTMLRSIFTSKKK